MPDDPIVVVQDHREAHRVHREACLHVAGYVLKGLLLNNRSREKAEKTWIDHIEKAWATGPKPELPNYEAGSWGPAAADKLIEDDGRVWRKP